MRSTRVPDADGSCDGRAPGRWEWWAAFAAALVLSDALDAALYGAFGRYTMLLPGLPVSRLPLLVLIAAAALLLASDRRAALETARAAWIVWPPLLLALLSAAWSVQPATTLSWTLALFATSAFGIGLASRFSAAAQVRLTTAVALTVVLASVVVAVGWPRVGIAADGRWQGIFVDKNLLGKLAALGIVAAIVGLVRRPALAPVAVAALCAAVMAATRSRASLLAGVAAVGAVGLLLAARRWPARAALIVVGGGLAILIGLTALVGTSAGRALLARNDSLSARTRIWSAVAPEVVRAPWLGHGYGAFWPSPSGERVHTTVRFRAAHSHNGALDLAAELGIAGLLAVLLPMGFIAIAAVRHALDSGAIACLWPAAYVCFFIVSNAAESPLLRHKLGWALYVAVACHVLRAASRASRP